MDRALSGSNVTLTLSPEDIRTVYCALSYARDAYAESADWCDFKGEHGAHSHREYSWECVEVMKEVKQQAAPFGLDL